jgi:hypothetical protein
MKFIPFVLPVVAGATVEFPNNDKSWHNVFSRSETKRFDLGLYPPGKTRSQVFNKPGIVRLPCNAHPAMEAFIVVKDHRCTAAPDKRGNFRLDGVPLELRKMAPLTPIQTHQPVLREQEFIYDRAFPQA